MPVLCMSVKSSLPLRKNETKEVRVLQLRFHRSDIPLAAPCHTVCHSCQRSQSASRGHRSSCQPAHARSVPLAEALDTAGVLHRRQQGLLGARQHGVQRQQQPAWCGVEERAGSDVPPEPAPTARSQRTASTLASTRRGTCALLHHERWPQASIVHVSNHGHGDVWIKNTRQEGKGREEVHCSYLTNAARVAA